jgi:sRNA-binding protein
VRRPLVTFLILVSWTSNSCSFSYSVKNDAQLLGGNGISAAQLREIEAKPDIKALKEAGREERRKQREERGEAAAEAEDELVEDDEEEEEILLNPDDSILILTGANASGEIPFSPSTNSR